MLTEAELDDALSRPTSSDVEALAALEGDLLILGVGGKLGPSLAKLARRASDEAHIERSIIGVSRFRDARTRSALEGAGIDTIACDLLDPSAVARLPDCPNVVYMVGHKFGADEDHTLTWATNVHAAALAADRYRDSRIVAFSTGNVYPLTPVSTGGPTESHPPGPVGEYAQSALHRERILEYFSRRHGTPISILRLNYAVELRYGVLRDVADRVYNRQAIDLTTGYVNVIWQRDAGSIALRTFAHCCSPPFILNVTGVDTLSVRDLATHFGDRFGIAPIFHGSESETALLSNAARCGELFGKPTVPTDRIVDWVADWVAGGGQSLGRPTHYEERKGRF